MNITINQLKAIMPHAKTSSLVAYHDPLNEAMERFFINTPLRQAAFLAQVAHESGSLQFTEEIWGPTQQQLDYSNTEKNICHELGNDQKEALEIAEVIGKPVGQVFRGRGLLQLTGYANYKRMSERFGWALTTSPVMAAEPKFSCLIAAAYWFVMGLNGLADRKDMVTITRRINGGSAGLTNRLDFYNVAKKVLAEAEV